MKLLLDTSVIIDFLRRKDKEASLFFKLSQENYVLYISIITHTELFSGKRVWEQKRLYDELEELCSGLEVLSIDPFLSQKAGHARVHFGMQLADAIIAATALHHDLSLATFNTKDFKQVKGLKLFTESN